MGASKKRSYFHKLSQFDKRAKLSSAAHMVFMRHSGTLSSTMESNSILNNDSSLNDDITNNPDDLDHEFLEDEDEYLDEFSSEFVDDFEDDGSSSDDEGSNKTSNDNNASSVLESNLSFSISEIAMLELITLCDSVGASLGFYDKLMVTVRKHMKHGFKFEKAQTRRTFITNLRKKVYSPPPKVSSPIGTSLKVIHFPILDMLKDLLGSVHFQDINNLCVNKDESSWFSKYTPDQKDVFSGMQATRWYQDTYNKLATDPLKEIVIPLILYGDKTGTDVLIDILLNLG